MDKKSKFNIFEKVVLAARYACDLVKSGVEQPQDAIKIAEQEINKASEEDLKNIEEDVIKEFRAFEQSPFDTSVLSKELDFDVADDLSDSDILAEVEEACLESKENIGSKSSGQKNTSEEENNKEGF